MRKPKTPTERAMEHKRDAYTERICHTPPTLAHVWEREAERLLTLPGPPDVGPGGEVVRQRAPPEGLPMPAESNARYAVRNTLEQGANRIAEEASVRRTDLLMQPSFNVVALAMDAADSIGAANSIEKMLSHQMAVTHEMALRLADRALAYEAGGRHMREGDSVEACRLANTAARLMSTFQDAALTLQRLRTGGAQTVTVQHVNVAPGGQAVIGNVRTGGNGSDAKEVRAQARAGGAGAGGDKPKDG